MITLTGQVSTFGGPGDGPAAGNDRGDWRTEGLALFDPSDLANPRYSSLFRTPSDPSLTGMARRLNPERFYCAARWDYTVTPRSWLRDNLVVITNPANGHKINCQPVDWGPGEWTGKEIDLSPAAARFLGLKTGDTAQMLVPIGGGDTSEPYRPPPDPRDRYRAKSSGEGESMLGNLLLPLIVTLITKFAPKLIEKLLGKFLGAAGRAEVEIPGQGQGKAKEDRAKELVGAGKVQGLGDVIIRAILSTLVDSVNASKGNDELLRVAQATGADGKLMLEHLTA